MSRQCELTAKKPLFGNNVSHSQRKSRRRFNVNVQQLRLRSDALKQDVSLKIATSTLRTITKHGGLDSFLKNTSNRKLTETAIELKNKILKAAA